MKFLFLDIDGVLNGHQRDENSQCGKIHPYRVELLNHVLRETGAKIVLSSAWRYLVHNGHMTLEGMDWLLRSHGVMAGRLVGVTCVDTMIPDPAGGPKEVPLPNERGNQITTWLETHARAEEVYFAAIDDLDLGIKEAGINLVLTDGKKGMTYTDAERLIWLLGGGGAAMIFLDIPQGGEQWLQWRTKGIGASEAPMIMGVSPWGDALTLWKRKMGLEPEEVSTFAMRRGLRLEPIIRTWYAKNHGIDAQPCVVASERLPWMRASLDGLDPWGEIVLEIKAPNEDAHRQALGGEVPDYYWPQVQHQLAVVDTARVCHYLSYSEKASVAENDRFALVVVERDEEYIAKLVEREAWFWDCLQRRVEPVEVAA